MKDRVGRVRRRGKKRVLAHRVRRSDVVVEPGDMVQKVGAVEILDTHVDAGVRETSTERQREKAERQREREEEERERRHQRPHVSRPLANVTWLFRYACRALLIYMQGCFGMHAGLFWYAYLSSAMSTEMSSLSTFPTPSRKI